MKDVFLKYSWFMEKGRNYEETISCDCMHTYSKSQCEFFKRGFESCMGMTDCQ